MNLTERRAKPWDRTMWGVEFKGAIADDKPTLIGTRWSHNMNAGYAGEPTRALLFTTRELAREWCHRQVAKYKGRNDVCERWRFKPVRVRETVRIV